MNRCRKEEEGGREGGDVGRRDGHLKQELPCGKIQRHAVGGRPGKKCPGVKAGESSAERTKVRPSQGPRRNSVPSCVLDTSPSGSEPLRVGTMHAFSTIVSRAKKKA